MINIELESINNFQYLTLHVHKWQILMKTLIVVSWKLNYDCYDEANVTSSSPSKINKTRSNFDDLKNKRNGEPSTVEIVQNPYYGGDI